jgi:hypothetical protein
LDTSLPDKEKNLPIWDSEKGVYDKQVIWKTLSRNKFTPHRRYYEKKPFTFSKNRGGRGLLSLGCCPETKPYYCDQ